TQHRRVERAAREQPGVDRPLDQLDGLARDAHRYAGPAVELAHLAVGPEPAPPLLEVVDPAPGLFVEAAWAADDDHVGVAPHGREPHAVDRRRRSSGPPGRRLGLPSVFWEQKPLPTRFLLPQRAGVTPAPGC